MAVYTLASKSTATNFVASVDDNTIEYNDTAVI